jgi:hypothetical protein
MNKYEQLIESILNEDEATAKALFHDIVVAKSREIYESLMDEELGGNQAQSFVQDITQQDEQAQDMGLGEDDLEGGEIELDGGDEDFGDEETFGDDDMGGEEGEHAEIATKLDDLEAQLADLKAMLGDEGGEEDFGGDDMGDDLGGDDEGENDFDMDGGDDASGDDDGVMEAMTGSGKSGSGMSGSGKSGSGASGSGKAGSGKMEGYVRKTEAEIMKEYVDKIGEIYKGDQTSPTGKMAGAGTGEMGGQHGEQNVDSIVGPGADFGGTNANIAKGGAEQNPDGKAYTKPKNIYSKGETTFSNETFQNAPGGNAGKTAFKAKTEGHGAEKKSGAEGKLVGADGSRPVNTKSVQAQNTGKK